MHQVTVSVRSGRSSYVDEGGAVFAPSASRGVTMPVFTYGSEEAQRHCFTCPVSAIPPAVVELYHLWVISRAMKLPPVPGGALDQPEIVQRSFAVFEAEMAPMEREAASLASVMGTQALMAGLLGGGAGPRRRR